MFDAKKVPRLKSVIDLEMHKFTMELEIRPRFRTHHRMEFYIFILGMLVFGKQHLEVLTW